MPLKLPISKEPEIRQKLTTEGFAFFDNNNAFWRAKKGKETVVFFKKGSLMIQGGQAETQHIEKLLGIEKLISEITAPQLEIPANTNILGLDESGKGDFFGPLVLAGAVLNNSKIYDIVDLQDSKTLTDKKIESVFPKLTPLIKWKVAVLEPSEYNRLYARHANLNHLMIEQYIKLIQNSPANTFEYIILDKFSQSNKQNNTIRQQAGFPITITERAEVYPAVAAASIIARYHFIKWIKNKSAELNIDLPLGSGTNAKALFIKLKMTLSPDDFASIAKTHFKTTADKT